MKTRHNVSSTRECGICEGAMKTEERASDLAIAEEEGESGGENAEERREERGERKKSFFLDTLCLVFTTFQGGSL